MRAGAHTCAQVCLQLCCACGYASGNGMNAKGEGAKGRGVGWGERKEKRAGGVEGRSNCGYREEASPTHFSSPKKPSPLSFCILSLLLFPPCRSALSLPALLSPCCCSACCRAVIALPAIAVFSLLTACCFAFTTCIAALLLLLRRCFPRCFLAVVHLLSDCSFFACEAGNQVVLYCHCWVSRRCCCLLLGFPT